ncbi:hypothetical protein L227DRAFT_519553 [Lentinus tigrinus ALCF2SS1-6]|uniref:Peroxisomal membrane protein PEX14 n=1 Tax=Lentinus tigrinus ALCF2SS1-6 TaxID=1328759 RepID=A0A5C2SUI6_9APHY|nr:hypothetical protein L227DRAFT_519553 [Lentinus tigrinus ALCF2SS1-6]
MTTPDRQELMRNAVAFLADPKAQASPLAQRIQFLEAKGLTAPEIEEAMRQATANQTAPRPSMQAYPPGAYGPAYGPMPYSPVQPPLQWDWRDYFITAVVSGTVAYGTAALFRKYVLPHLKPPSATAYEQDKDAMAAQFDAAEALLKEIQAETAAVRTAVEEQNEKVAKVTQDVEDAVKDMRDNEIKTRDEMREVREEVNNVREMLPKMIEKNKESHNQSLAELQQELKSLKALLLSRGPSMSTGPSTPILPGKPSIPAWQLAGNSPVPSVPSTPPAHIPPSNSSTPSPAVNGNGKGKERLGSRTVKLSYPGSHHYHPQLRERRCVRRVALLVSSMFSQLRHAVENLAQAPKSSQDASNATETPARASTDSSIRTSFSQSPGQSPSPAAAESTPTAAPKPRPAGRTTLEDRLRAKFAVGDVSGTSTPSTSTRASPSPVPTTDHPLAAPSEDKDMPSVKGPPNPLSPKSTPLPDSPLVSPTTEAPMSLHAATESISSIPKLSESPSPEPSASGEETADAAPGISQDVTSTPPEDASSPDVQPVSSPVQSSDEDLPAATDETEVQPVAAAVSSPEPEAAPASTSDEQKDASPSQTELASAPESQGPAPDAPQVIEHVSEDVSDASPAESAPSVDAPAEDPSAAAVEDDVADDPVPDSTSVPVSDGPANIDLDNPRSATPSGKAFDGVDVEALQKRLKLVEQRFTDVSTSFKRLQAEKLAADRVLRELTSVESVTEADGLRDYLQNMNFKTEMAQDEIRRLTGKLTRQDERLEELRDIHRLESKSLTDQIDKLKSQLEEAEKLLKASQASTSQVEQESAKRKAEIDRLQGELDKATNNAKEEEEKRTKAIALLKTVRQKLVKAEKERDDALKEVATLKETEKAEREKEKAEKAKLQAEIEKVNSERETALQGMRAHFDKEMAAMKEKHEKELAALRGQFELEAITTKTTHVREMENKKARISDLESTVRTISKDKDELFDQLQLRQAELESSQSTLESLQGQNTELQYQLREATDRIALLQEEFSDVRHEQHMKVAPSGPSAEEVTRLLTAAESKYETKLSDLRRRLAEAERERDEGEAHWSKKLAERAREVDSLKAVINSSQKSKDAESESAQALKDEIQALQDEIRSYQKQISDLRAHLEKTAEVEIVAKNQLAELSAKTADLQQFVDESKSREAQLRVQNKTLREELRKVQSSVALLEKQRGPGVGYWASRNESTSEIRSPVSSVSDLPSREISSRPSSPSTGKSEEEVNFEYLRNIILQFLEHKEMRPHLIRILSTILRFTPQETRRLIAKV